jgi:AcrR family transcriptional regulator
MEDVKTRIIENALEQFAQYGYKKTSLDDIVQNVGISKGTIYNYFKNKEDLFKQTVIVEYDNMLSHIKSLIKKGTEPKNKLILYVSQKIEYSQDFFSTKGRNLVIIKELRETYYQLEAGSSIEVDILKEILEAGKEENKIKAKNLNEYANLICQIIRQFEFRWFEMKTKEAKTEIQALFELMFEGLEA